MKETFFFSHDYNARNDPKMQRLLMKHGCAGIGVFWCIIEQLYEQGGELPMDEYESIAFALRVDAIAVQSIINESGLFKNDGVIFWSESVKNRLNKRSEIAEKRKKAAMNRWGKSQNDDKKQQLENNSMQVHEKDMQLHQNSMQDYASKVKESKVKESKGNNINQSTKVDCAENEFSDDCDLTSLSVDTSEEKEKSSAKKESFDFDRVVSMFHENCQSFPKIMKLSDARKKKIKSRMTEMKNDFTLLLSVFQKMEESSFLRGENKNGWQASFDWVFENDKNWMKVMEGNYSNKTTMPVASMEKIDITDALQQSLIKKHLKI